MTTNMFKILMIGAGGVASYLIPPLQRSFKEMHLTVMDADVLEEKNLDRQCFNEDQIGRFKAEALLEVNKISKDNGHAINKYLENSFAQSVDARRMMKDVDVVICVADNHPARRAAILLAETFFKPIIIGANEEYTSQAYIHHNIWQIPTSPIVRYPEIGTSDAGSPIRCTGEALESTPQLAIANDTTASLICQLLYLWSRDGFTAHDHRPIEFQTTFGRTQTITVEDVRSAVTAEVPQA